MFYLAFFVWWDGNVDKYSLFGFFSCNLIYRLNSCKLTHLFCIPIYIN